MILAGDIGGTKTLLALFDATGQCVKKQNIVSADFKKFDDLLSSFLEDGHRDVIRNVCLGVAGPIVNGDCNATNLPWSINRQTISDITGSDRVRLLNDLEATAWGVLSLPAEAFFELNSEAQSNRGNIAVLAAGTGLGEAIISWNGCKHHVISTEGGHTDFAPQDALEIELLRFLMERYSGHVSYERVVSGMGLQNIYEFLKAIGYCPHQDETEELVIQKGAGAAISQMANEGKDELCIKAMQLFCRIYGAEAGNLALKTLAYGGVILAGGIAPKNLSLFQQGEFMDGFVNKGRYRELLRTLSVRICLNPEAALLGAANYAITSDG